jgi:hypothetical protein
MKAIFISFNQAYYDAILAIMDRNALRGFTYWEEVRGRGSEKGIPHYGSHAWPTLNSALLIIAEEKITGAFLDQLHSLDLKTEEQGLRAFVWDIEQTI